MNKIIKLEGQVIVVDNIVAIENRGNDLAPRTAIWFSSGIDFFKTDVEEVADQIGITETSKETMWIDDYIVFKKHIITMEKKIYYWEKGSETDDNTTKITTNNIADIYINQSLEYVTEQFMKGGK